LEKSAPPLIGLNGQDSFSQIHAAQSLVDLPRMIRMSGTWFPARLCRN
jgi:hypothetical protein